MLRWLVPLCALGCAGAAPAVKSDPAPAPAAYAARAASEPRSSPRQEPPINVSLRVQAASRGARRPIGPGEALHSGDRIEMYLEVDQPAYVYVVQFFPDHSSAVLFPPEGDLRLRPGAPHRIPARGQSFPLDEATGEANIYGVATGKPLAQADVSGGTAV